MSKTDFKKYFNCEPSEAIEERLLQFPAKCGVLYKDEYSFRGFHCICDNERIKSGNLCSVVYYFKASWSEVAKVTYHAACVDNMMGAEVFLNDRQVGWIEKDLNAYYYCPATIFSEGIMAELFEVMSSIKRAREKRAVTENTKVILRAEERTDENTSEEKEDEVVENLREEIANMF